MRMRVDFPAPFGPSRPNMPVGISREIACTELEFNVEHLHLYSKKVLQDIDKLKSSTTFSEYIQAHESYWNSKSVDELQPQAVAAVPNGVFT